MCALLFCFSCSSTFPLAIQPVWVTSLLFGYTCWTWYGVGLFCFSSAYCFHLSVWSRLAVFYLWLPEFGYDRFCPFFLQMLSWKWNPLETNTPQSNIWRSRFLSSLLAHPTCLHFSFRPKPVSDPQSRRKLVSQVRTHGCGYPFPSECQIHNSSVCLVGIVWWCRPPWRWIPHTGIRLGGEKLNESICQSEMEFWPWN